MLTLGMRTSYVHLPGPTSPAPLTFRDGLASPGSMRRLRPSARGTGFGSSIGRSALRRSQDAPEELTTSGRAQRSPPSLPGQPRPDRSDSPSDAREPSGKGFMLQH